ncbi:hypothetical protein SDC9_192495 [bioreactor metagenome]|uniref:Uncharacterized protein n=1 Tax=bioreactor metagenome TaxID=1076179 RepID=A0A645I0Z8_9ZZZZ
MHQRAGEAHPLLHPLRQPGEVFVPDAAEVGELLDFGERPGARRPLQPEAAGEKVEVLPDPDVAEVRQRIRHVTDQPPHFVRVADRRYAVIKDVARIGIVERAHDLDRRGFPRTVRPDEAEDVPGGKFERNVIHRFGHAERADQIANLNFHLWSLPQNCICRSRYVRLRIDPA